MRESGGVLVLAIAFAGFSSRFRRCWMIGMSERILMGVFFLGYIAGEVLFAEVLVTPTGISKGCGCVLSFPRLG